MKYIVLRQAYKPMGMEYLAIIDKKLNECLFQFEIRNF